MKKLLGLIVAIVILINYVPAAHSIQGGNSALGSARILTLARTLNAREPWCSMALLKEDVVVTAAHCLESPNTSNGVLRFNIDDLWVTNPGIDMNIDDLETRIKVTKVAIYPTYAAFFNQKLGDLRSQEDDIALLLLAKPLIKDYKVEIATAQDVANLVQSKTPVTVYGYGYQNSYKLSGLDKMDGKPYFVSLFPRGMNGTKRMQITETGTQALCPGDSGGPWYANVDGVNKIVAVNMTGSGCETNPPGQYFADGTLIYPYLDFIESTLKLFDLARLAEIASSNKDAARKAAAEKAAAEEAAIGRAAQEKITSDGLASAKAAPTKIPTIQKITITCKIGKNIKKVKSVKPVCPHGYKKIS